jgi:hypothetical protein
MEVLKMGVPTFKMDGCLQWKILWCALFFETSTPVMFLTCGRFHQAGLTQESRLLDREIRRKFAWPGSQK